MTLQQTLEITPSSVARIQIGRSNLDVMNVQQSLEKINLLSQLARPSFIVTPNADHIVMLEESPKFRNAYNSADLYLCDGMPLIWAAKLWGVRIPERVTGADLLPAIAQLAASTGKSIFLLGAEPGVGLKAAEKLAAQFSGLQIKGIHSPPLGFENSETENKLVIDMINAAGADFVFVALGAPKQELWIHNNLKSFNRGVFLGVGAAIDFAAGHVRRAPRFMQKAGLEWLYRLITDPKRLTKRYLKDTRFFLIILKQWLAQFHPKTDC